MRITKNQLRQIIKEELSGVLREATQFEPVTITGTSDRGASSLSNDELGELMRGGYGANPHLRKELDARIAAGAVGKGVLVNLRNELSAGGEAPMIGDLPSIGGGPSSLEDFPDIPVEVVQNIETGVDAPSRYSGKGSGQARLDAESARKAQEEEGERRLAPGAIDESRRRRKARKVRRK